MQPPLRIPMMTTMWQCHITSPSAYAVLMVYVEDNLAHQWTCHIVQTMMMHAIITVHINPGKCLLSPSPLFTQEAGNITTNNR